MDLPDDVDSLKQLVRSLKQQLTRIEGMDRFRLVVESAPNGIIVSNREGRIVMTNPKAQELFGYTEEEFVERTIEDLVPRSIRDSHPGRRDDFHQHPASRPMGAGRDLYARHSDGQEFPVEIALTPFPGEEEGLVLSSIVDISKRKEVEDELLRYSRELERSNKVLENVHDAVFHVTREGDVRDWNEGAARIFGISAEDAIGKRLEDICPPRHGSHPFRDRILPAIDQDGKAEETIQCHRGDGTEIHILAKVTPLSQDQEDGYVFCASDITREKRLEAELVRIAENEQRRIGQDIHDDLCSQLSGIGCLTKVLEQQLERHEIKEAEMMARVTEMVSNAGVKAREIARGLVPTVLENQGLSGAILELASRQRELYSVNCTASVDGEESIESLDQATAVQLYRIAQEAVSNAIKHSDAEKISLGLMGLEGGVTLTIEDDGKGMYPGSSSSGMGLLTMGRRAEIIGADFDISASPGEGTRIRCALSNGAL